MNVHKGNDQMQLFNLQTDSLETTDVAAEHPEIVEKMWEYIKESHQPVPNDVERYKMTVNFPE
jgi:arylsulfatase